MAVDDTMRKLVVPPHFVPYLEKYKIYEIFYDLSLALALDRPHDHVLYLRNQLSSLVTDREIVKIILFAPAHIDRAELASEIAETLKLEVITLCDVTKGDVKCYENSKLLAERLKEYIFAKNLEKKGWILYDFPRTKQDARAFQKEGLTPTHTFQLVPSPHKYTSRDMWNEKLINWTEADLVKMLLDYKNRIMGLRNVYRFNLKEIPIRGRRLHEIAKAVVLLSKQMQNRTGPPCLPRVVLIGPRGSYRRTIAKMLSKRFRLVHVEMNELLEQGKLKQNNLGKQIKELYDRNLRIYGRLMVALLEDRLLDYDCLNRGWVLTGFPRDRADFEILDSFDTPPNRVIFLNKNSLECLNRIKNRRIHLYNGDIKSLDEIKAMGDEEYGKQFVIHPHDEEKRLIIEDGTYSKELKGMLEHAGQNCTVISGEGTVDEVYDRVERVIIFPAPKSPPRVARDREKIIKEIYRTKSDEHISITTEESLEPESKLTVLSEEVEKVQPFVSCESIYPLILTKDWLKLDLDVTESDVPQWDTEPIIELEN